MIANCVLACSGDELATRLDDSEKLLVRITPEHVCLPSSMTFLHTTSIHLPVDLLMTINTPYISKLDPPTSNIHYTPKLMDIMLSWWRSLESFSRMCSSWGWRGALVSHLLQVLVQNVLPLTRGTIKDQKTLVVLKEKQTL